MLFPNFKEGLSLYCSAPSTTHMLLYMKLWALPRKRDANTSIVHVCPLSDTLPPFPLCNCVRVFNTFIHTYMLPIYIDLYIIIVSVRRQGMNRIWIFSWISLSLHLRYLCEAPEYIINPRDSDWRLRNISLHLIPGPNNLLTEKRAFSTAFP